MTTTHVKTCPYCQSPIEPQADTVVCPLCGIPHHRECWEENRRCTTYGCRGTRIDDEPDGDIALPIIEMDVGPILAEVPSHELPAECPAKLRRWNWGAFVLTPWWTFTMRQAFWFVLALLPGIGIVAACYLALNGNELAWKSRHWASADHFADTQRIWNFCGIVLFILELIGVVLLLLPAAG